LAAKVSHLTAKLKEKIKILNEASKVKNSNPLRINSRKLLFEVLHPYKDEIPELDSDDIKLEKVVKLSEDIELGIYLLYKNEVDKKLMKNYLGKCKEIYACFKSNPELRYNLFNGNLEADKIATYDKSLLLRKEVLEKHKKVQEDDFSARRTDWNRIQVDKQNKEGFYTCYRCRQKKTTYFQMQTRRADEGMTTFVNCLNCGNNWKC
jgi:DNA-directed RNA polymerase subunit M/transcription elongation factor TFIIS